MRKWGGREHGFTLIEVMVTTGLLSVVLLSLLSVLSDYTEIFQDAQSRTAMMSLRRRIIQNLNRRDAWINTFMASQNTAGVINSQMECLWDIYSGTYPTGCSEVATYYPLVVLTQAPVTSAAEAANATVVDSTSATSGFTRRGVPCTTFNATANTAAAKRCPIRVVVEWRLLHNGVPRDYFPTGYFPSSYYPAAYWPGGGSGFWWFGTIGAQIEVRVRFLVNQYEIGNMLNLNNYDFSLIKSVP